MDVLVLFLSFLSTETSSDRRRRDGGEGDILARESGYLGDGPSRLLLGCPNRWKDVFWRMTVLFMLINGHR